MGLAIALVVILITCLSGYFFLAKTWWFPVHITANYGHAIDHQFMLTLAITGAIFVVAQLALAYAVWRYRDRRDGRKAGYSHGNNKLELTWTTAAAIIFIGLNLMGYHIWAFVHFMGPQPGSMRVEVWENNSPGTFDTPAPMASLVPCTWIKWTMPRGIIWVSTAIATRIPKTTSLLPRSPSRLISRWAMKLRGVVGRIHT